MKKLKINFVDFWPNFKKNDNYFFNLLSTKYELIIEESNPDFIFFSLGFGKNEIKNYINHDCKKIFFTGENVRPNLYFPGEIIEKNYKIQKCDFSFSFDYTQDQRNYRLPLWVMFINWFNVPHSDDRDISYLIPLENLLERKLHNKKNFCNFIYSNNQGRRLEILESIKKYKHIDCAGRLMNNMKCSIQGRGDQKYKIKFINDYKFTIASENSKNDGYTTEKIIHPLSVGSIPIYWGSSKINLDFNKNCFINVDDYENLEHLAEHIVEVDSDAEKYEKYLTSPIFPDNKIPEHLKPESVLHHMEKYIL